MSEVRTPLKTAVVIATRGRADETATLVHWLERSTLRPARVLIVGVEENDWRGTKSDVFGPDLMTIAAPSPGLTRQRNAGIDHLSRDTGALPDVIIFFDDDFRPHPGWIEHATRMFQARPDIIGITGHVLIDGAKTIAVTEAIAMAAIDVWDSRTNTPTPVSSLYGCNMALRARAFDFCRFDERLPLYGWLEDMDFSGQAARHGALMRAPGCAGVHLGAKSARVSGLRYGYSQIVNPLHLAARRTCSLPRAMLFVTRALASNSVRSIRTHPLFDYRGRLKGNLLALADMLRGRARPERILDI